MLRITKRENSRHFQIRGKCPFTGERVRRSTFTDRRDEAEGVLAKFIADRQHEAVHGSHSLVTFAEATVEYLGKGGEGRYLKPLLNALGRRRMAEITDQDLTLEATRAYPGASPATLVRQWYGPMQAVWNAAARSKMVPERTFAKPEVKRRPARYARDERINTLVAAMTNERQIAAVLFMTFSGARASEVVAVTGGDFDREARTVLLRHTKNGDARVIYLPEMVYDKLIRIAPADASAKLFGYASRFSLNRILKRSARRAGVDNLPPHAVGRHGFAARLLRSGASLKAVQEAGGWKSASVVSNTYAHLERGHIEALVRGVQTSITDTAVTQTAPTPNSDTVNTLKTPDI